MAATTTTTTPAMQTMIDLNNQAVVLIQNGYYKMSATVLRSALAEKQEEEQQDGEGDDRVGGDSTANDMIRRSSRSETKRNRPSSPAVSSNNKKKHAAQGPGGKTLQRRHSLLMQKSIADDTDFVYRRPIHIPSNGQIMVERGEGETKERNDINNTDEAQENGFVKHRLTESDIDCIVLFNLALSFHLAALESSVIYSDTKKQHKMLKKSLKLYEMSFNLQVELGVLTLSETLAVVNNCSTIYKRLDHPDRAECFYQRMLSTIMTVIEAGDPDVKDELKDLDGFLHNICSSGLILKHIAAPAA
mmetsp:Transcript_38177/g.92856  ORF Transcript_38177/g.92856 Transcript_38177/m.92856 type:complete len:303 (-) Transcript_38177:162-1070(-)|eukprot:CAMPEP_0113483828 /NCGR_PEP_ID=MMETSP0014_2-20120614/23639_1 /TAXON_ID=2857 /ORGANISM="Nitzschia sp." /LENGTH=302 /DNA_ID=CAMNT_0000377395 /DNA_START=507 /DNA_END=1415 /DNA_ORIENTATION=+ /assembly_acc=CAM_ASM_000159